MCHGGLCGDFERLKQRAIRGPAPPILLIQPTHCLSLLLLPTLIPSSYSHKQLQSAAKMISSLTIVLALAVAAQAAPTSERAVSSFSLPAVHNTAGVRNGTAAMLKAYSKWGLTPTKLFSDNFLSQLNLLGKRQDGSAPASPDSNNVEYTVPVTIGGQELNLDFDTGSADL